MVQEGLIRRKNVNRFLIESWLVALVVGSLWAVPRAGSIGGTVKSTTGAGIEQAQIAVSNQRTGETKTATADKDGAYLLPDLAPGEYRVAVLALGFYPQAQLARIEANDQVNLNFLLQPRGEDTQETEEAASERATDPGTSIRTQEWNFNLEGASIFPGRVFPAPFNFGMGANYRSTFDPNGVLLSLGNVYVRDESGITDRLRKALEETSEEIDPSVKE